MTDQNNCFICGDQRQNSLEQHHIVPKRFNGSDDDENLVTLCASCHAAIEKLYDRRFYEELGVEKQIDDTACGLDGCTATADKPLDDHGDTFRVCSDHAEKCGAGRGLYAGYCTRTAVSVVQSYYDNKILLRCDEHNSCGERGCKSKEVFYDPESVLPYERCIEHFEDTDAARDKRRQ
jgi:hypothetical protein